MKRILLMILALAGFARLFALGQNPPALYWDEVALGYDAYSIWKTGKDLHGNPWPIVAFESYGDWKPSGYFYLAAPFVGILGLNEWALRLPSALAGVLAIYLVYLIAIQLFEDKKAGLAAAFSLAIMPWHIHISRVAFEVNVATTLLCAGILFLLKSRTKTWMILPSALFFALSTYTYHSLRILAPLVAALTFVLFARKLIKTVWLWSAVAIAILVMLPILVNLNNPIVTKRFAETSFFNESTAVATTNRLREAAGNTLWARLIYHRYWFWGSEIVTAMVKHISPEFLFVRGDGNSRHQVLPVGILYWWMAFPLIVGLIKFKTNKISLLFLVGWIALAALPPALALPNPHTLRFLPAAPAFALLIGYGIWQLSRLNNRIIIGSMAILVLIETSRYGDIYTSKYKEAYSFDWQYGYKQLFSYLETHVSPGEKVTITRELGRPSQYYLFFNQIDPKMTQAISPAMPKDQSELLEFNNYQFGSFNDRGTGWKVSRYPLSTGILETQIKDLSGKPVFYVYH